MKRILTVAALIAACSIATPAEARTPGWRLQECRYQFHDGRAGWSRLEVKATIRCAAPKFGVSLTTAIYVADRESSFFQFARNPYSGAAGVYQHIPRFFPGRLANVPDKLRPLGPSIFDARSNVLAALWMARNGWSPWGL